MEENKERALEELKKLEPYRIEFPKKARRKFFLKFLSPLLITIPCWIAGHYFINIAIINNPLTIACYIFGACSVFCFCSPLFYLYFFKDRFDNELKNEINKVIMPLVLSDFGDIKYIRDKKRKNQIIPKSQIEECGLFSFSDNILIDDAFSGFYYDMPFKISEISLYRQIMHRHYVSYHYSFKGMLLSLKLKQNRNRILITTTKDVQDENKDLAVQLGLIMFLLAVYNYVAYFAYDSTGEAIKSISISLLIAIALASYTLIKYNLNKKKGVKKPKNEFVIQEGWNFYVYSDDTEDSMPSREFLNKLTELRKGLDGKNIRCSFYENNLMVAIDTERDLFELVYLDKPLDDLRNILRVDRFYKELNAIYDFMDYIKNDEELN